MTLGFPTIVIPALSAASTDSTFVLSKEQISWLGKYLYSFLDLDLD